MNTLMGSAMVSAAIISSASLLLASWLPTESVWLASAEYVFARLELILVVVYLALIFGNVFEGEPRIGKGEHVTRVVKKCSEQFMTFGLLPVQ